MTMITATAALDAVIDLAGGSETEQLAQVTLLQDTTKEIGGLVATATRDEQLALFRAACALSERVGHQDSFGVMRQLNRHVHKAFGALGGGANAELVALAETTLRRRLNQETLARATACAGAKRALAIMEELKAAGTPYPGWNPDPNHYDGALDALREMVAEDEEEDEEEEPLPH